MCAAALLAACAAPAQYGAQPLNLQTYPAAQQSRSAPTGTQTYLELLRFALDNSAQVAAAKARLKAAQAEAARARVRAPVSLTLTAEYANEAGADSPWMFGLGSDIPLERGAARAARLTEADLPVIVARYELARAVWNVRHAVNTAMADYANGGELGAAQALVRERIALLTFLDRRASAGEESSLESARARMEVGAAESEVTAALAGRTKASAALIAALGLPPGARLAGVSDARRATGDPSARRTEAALTRPEVLSALAEYDLAEAQLRGEVARQYPAISIGPGFEWERGLTKLPFDLSLSLPPGGRNQAGIAAAEARRTAAARTLEAAQEAVLAEFDAAYRDWTGAVARRDAAQARLLAQNDARRLLLRLAQAGEQDMGPVLSLDADIASGQLEAARAQAAAALAMAAIESTLQTSFDPAEQAMLDQYLQSLGAD